MKSPRTVKKNGLKERGVGFLCERAKGKPSASYQDELLSREMSRGATERGEEIGSLASTIIALLAG